MTLEELSDILTEEMASTVSMDDVLKLLEKEGNTVKKVGNLYHVKPKGGHEYSVS